MCTWSVSTISSLALYLPELVPVRHGHPRPPEGPSLAAARCGGATNPTTEHRDAVGRSEVQLGVCIAHPGLSPGPINRRLRRRGHEVLFTPGQAFMQHSKMQFRASFEWRQRRRAAPRRQASAGGSPADTSRQACRAQDGGRKVSDETICNPHPIVDGWGTYSLVTTTRWTLRLQISILHTVHYESVDRREQQLLSTAPQAPVDKSR